MVDDWSDTCMGSYDGAEDAIYKLVVEDNVCLDISLSADTIWAGMAVDDVCPLSSGSTECIAKACTSANPDLITGLQLGIGTYYLMLDVYPSPSCYGYTLDITECSGPASVDPWGDMDADGYPNVCDNCEAVANAYLAGTCFNWPEDGDPCLDDGECPGSFCSLEQEDFDGDGVGDVCDNCPEDYNDGQENQDGDAFGDICDICPLDPLNDQDDDGVCVPDDLCPTDPCKSRPGQCGCGVGPMVQPCFGVGAPGFNNELDSDGDGVSDCIDQCPGVDDAIFAPGCAEAIPTMSQWGLAVLALLLAVLAKIYFGHRRRVTA
jgi:hypothetical protein